MENSIHLQVITSDGVFCDVMANYVEVPMVNGNYGILSRHAPMIGILKEGVACYQIDEKKYYFAVMRGSVSVENNEIKLLCIHAEYGDDIDIARARASEKRARERLKAREEWVDILRTQSSLARASAREKAHEKSINN